MEFVAFTDCTLLFVANLVCHFVPHLFFVTCVISCNKAQIIIIMIIIIIIITDLYCAYRSEDTEMFVAAQEE